MKQLILNLFVLFFFINTYSQDIHPYKISLTRPTEARSLSYSQFVALSNTKSPKSLSTDQHFQHGNLLVNYREHTVLPIEKSLEYKEKDLVGMMRLSSVMKNIRSEIVSENGHRFLLIRYVEGDGNFISFTSEADSRLTSIYGHIQYKNSDVNEAERFLPGFLRSFKFQ